MAVIDPPVKNVISILYKEEKEFIFLDSSVASLILDRELWAHSPSSLAEYREKTKYLQMVLSAHQWAMSGADRRAKTLGNSKNYATD